jgi:hypothetical protein
LREASTNHGLYSWRRWRDVIFLAMLPHDVNGALPARR